MIETLEKAPPSSLEEQIETSLIKQNVTDSVIASLKEKYGHLKLRSLDDKEMYLEIKDAKKVVSKVRTTAVKVCTDGREDAVKIQKLWVAKQKEVVGKIAEVETPLDTEIDAYDNEQARKKEEIKRQQEQAYIERTQALTRMGALYSDNSFALGETSIEGNLVKESSEDVWQEEILPKFKEEFEKAQAERLEQERQKAEHEAEIKRQQEELAKQQREFQEQQAEFKRQMEEKARIEKEKIDKEHEENRKVRSAQLSKMGMNYNGNAFVFSDIQIHWSELMSKTEAEWVATIEEITPAIEQKKIEQQKKQQEEIEKQKLAAAEDAARKERERIEQERIAAEEKRRLEEQKRAEELAKAGDKAIWEHFTAELSKIQLPIVKSGQYKRIANTAKSKIDEILSLKAY